MFKIFICLSVVAAASCVSGATIGRQAVDSTTEKREIVPLLRFETEKKPDGSFNFAYEGGDQSYRQESGHLENAGTEDEALEVSGSYRYIDADGQTVEVHYTAGKNGFVPTGTIILPEITAVAKAAADLPNLTYEQELEEKLNQRRARSKTEEKKEKKVVEVAQPEKKQLKTAESKIVPVQVLQQEVKPVEKPVETKKA